MKALLVTVNGQRTCLAGIGDSGVLATSINWVRRADEDEQFKFYVTGLGLDGLFSVWDVPELAVGDEVNVKIVEVDQVDPPSDTSMSGTKTRP